MNRRARGFTLAELLTVLAIIAILAGLLFPVFLSAKSSARRAQCLSNMQQSQLATSLYMIDYDEYFVPVNHRPAAPPNSRFDRTWVQLVLPYARSFALFNCPSDTGTRDRPETTFDQDLVPGDIYSQYYTASMRVNMGYNYLNLAPIVFRRGQWISEPRSITAINDTSKTLLFVDSVWDRHDDGTPYGGGNWLVVPPCRYQVNGPNTRIDTFTSEGIIYSPFVGWQSINNSPHRYGNAWPWHAGRINVAHVDGSVKTMPVEQLKKGCGFQDSWRGTIVDTTEYIWDTR